MIDEAYKQQVIQEYFNLLKEQQSEIELAQSLEAKELKDSLARIEESLSRLKNSFSRAKSSIGKIDRELNDLMNLQNESFSAVEVPPMSIENTFNMIVWQVLQDFNKLNVLISQVFETASSTTKLTTGLILIIAIFLLIALVPSILPLLFLISAGYILTKIMNAYEVYKDLHIKQFVKNTKAKYQNLVNDKHLERQKLVSEYQEYQNSINNLEYLREQNLAQLEELRLNQQEERFNKLRELDEQIQIFLEEDKDRLVEDAMEELEISNPGDSSSEHDYREELEKKPIVEFIGISSEKVSSNLVLKGDNNIDVDDKKYIKVEDFYNGLGLDGKRRYSVYEFVVIFLCRDFLSYYRCYWNFLRRTSIGKETGEYLYNKIVSIRIKEKSSINSKDPNQRRIYGDFLYLTTADGKTVSFWIARDSKEKILSKRTPKKYVSEVNLAAQYIRYMLRHQGRDDSTE